MNALNFKARYIRTAKVQKLEDDKYQPCEVAFVQFNPKKKNDLASMKEVANAWGSSYALNIYADAFDSMYFPEKSGHAYYGLVLPQKNYKKVNEENVLGIMAINKFKDRNHVEFLQVSPDIATIPPYQKKIINVFKFIGRVLTGNKEIYGDKKPEYKYVGSAILDSLKSISYKKNITLYSVTDSIDFYKKNDFKRLKEDDKNLLIWVNKKMK